MVGDTLHVNYAVGTEIQVQCQHCVGSTAHRIIVDAKLVGADQHMQWSTEYQTLQCMGCKRISFRSASSNSEDIDQYYDEYGEVQSEYSVTEKLYPSRISGYVGLKDEIWLLPDKLRRIYQETTQALITNQPVLTGIGVRAILETLCKDKAAKGATLFKQIDDLVAQGVLTPGRASVLHQIRTLGNLSAHEVEPHNPQQLGLAMFILDHLLEEVYILPEKAKKLFPPVRVHTKEAPALLTPTIAFPPSLTGASAPPAASPVPPAA